MNGAGRRICQAADPLPERGRRRPWLASDATVHLPIPAAEELAAERKRRPIECLTPVMRAILQGIVEGKTNRQIGQVIGWTENSVKTMTVKLYERMGVESRLQCAMLALQEGMADVSASARRPAWRQRRWEVLGAPTSRAAE